MQIEFAANDPGSAARGANAVAEAYLQSLTEARAKAAKATSDFLSARVDEMRLKVADADAEVAAARAQSTTFADC